MEAQVAIDGTMKRRYRDRPAPDQTLDEDSGTDPADFKGTQFVGYVQPQGVKFDSHGSLELRISVTAEFVDRALLMRAVFGLPLHVDVQLWKPYEDYDGR